MKRTDVEKAAWKAGCTTGAYPEIVDQVAVDFAVQQINAALEEAMDTFANIKRPTNADDFGRFAREFRIAIRALKI